mgnify:CR=1 FL=1
MLLAVLHYLFVCSSCSLIFRFIYTATGISVLMAMAQINPQSSLAMAVTMIDEKVRQIVQQDGQPFPHQLLIEIKHLVLSHHGQYEYGSPKLPMTPEAICRR